MIIPENKLQDQLMNLIQNIRAPQPSAKLKLGTYF